MSTKHDDGVPAYPVEVYVTDDCPRDKQLSNYSFMARGGTIWDEYAKAALSYCRGGDYGSFADLATDCANIADAMLAERRKRGIGT